MGLEQDWPKNLYDQAYGLFAVNHSFLYIPIRKRDKRKSQSLGYYYPPYYAFLPSELRSFKSFEVSWSYNLWHEFWHIRNMQFCYLGTYELILNYICEDLARYGLLSYANRKFSEGKRYIDKAIDIVRKIKILANSCRVANETSPTYYLLNEKTQTVVVNSICDDIIPTFFSGQSSISKERMYSFVKSVGTGILKDLKSRQEKIRHEIRPEHRAAYFIGEDIYRKYDDTKHIDLIPLMSMDVDLSRTDLIDASPSQLKDQLKEEPESLVPDYRLRKALKKGKVFVEQMKKTSEKMNAKFICSITKMVSHRSLPKSIRKKGSEFKMRFEAAKETFEQKYGAEKSKGMISHRVMTIRTQFGDIFLTLPIFLEKSGGDLAHEILSNAYASELLFRFCGISRYSDVFTLSLKSALEYPRPKVPGASLYHEEIEKMVKSVLTGKRFEKILPEHP